jgi:hypothetical protein
MMVVAVADGLVVTSEIIDVNGAFGPGFGLIVRENIGKKDDVLRIRV